MIAGTEAIVLQQIKYNDQSIIIRTYSRKFGMLSLLSSTTRRKGNRATRFLPLSIVEIVFYLKNNRGLQRLKEIHSSKPFRSIPFYAGKTAQAIFLAELISKSIKEEEENASLFSFLNDSIVFFDGCDGEMPDFHLKFMLDFTRHLGFWPINNYSVETPFFSFKEGNFIQQFNETCADAETSKAISQIIQINYENLKQIGFSGKDRSVLIRKILEYYQWQLPAVKELKTPAVLEEVFG